MSSEILLPKVSKLCLSELCPVEQSTIKEFDGNYKHSFLEGATIRTQDPSPIESITQFSFADKVEERLEIVKEVPKSLLKMRYIVEKIKKYCIRFNQDWLFLICGGEGSGKSNLGIQLAYILDPDFEMDKQMVYSFNEDYPYLKFIQDFREKPFRTVVFDEAVTALFSREHQKSEVRDAIKIFNMNRQLNHFSILIVPSFWSMDVDIRERRARTFLYVFQNEFNYKRYYAYYSRKKIPNISSDGNSRSLFLSPSLFLDHVKPNYVEPFPKMPEFIQGKYDGMKKDYFKEMLDNMAQKYEDLDEIERIRMQRAKLSASKEKASMAKDQVEIGEKYINEFGKTVVKRGIGRPKGSKTTVIAKIRSDKGKPTNRRKSVNVKVEKADIEKHVSELQKKILGKEYENYDNK